MFGCLNLHCTSVSLDNHPFRQSKIKIVGSNFGRGGLRSVVSHKSDFGNQEIRRLEL